MIKNATFTSVWDGCYEITTSCKVNTETHEVFDIEMVDVDEELEILDKEYITLDGVEYEVMNKNCYEDVGSSFWYE